MDDDGRVTKGGWIIYPPADYLCKDSLFLFSFLSSLLGLSWILMARRLGSDSTLGGGYHEIWLHYPGQGVSAFVSGGRWGLGDGLLGKSIHYSFIPGLYIYVLYLYIGPACNYST